MPSLKAIKRRLSSVDSTRQIVNAMDMVSASKLQKAKPQLEAARDFMAETSRVIIGAGKSLAAANHLFISGREVKNTLYIVITGDRGLCGSYNQNVSDAALSFMQTHGEGKIVTVGQQGYDFFLGREKNIAHSFTDISENAFYEDAAKVGDLAVSMFVSGETDEVFVAYTSYESALTHTPRVDRLLPFGADQKSRLWYETVIYEPDVHAFLELAAPLHINACIYAAMVEAAACEHTARMTSMQSASDNAGEILEELTSDYNNKRQGAVTQEISEIVSGAKALRKKH